MKKSAETLKNEMRQMIEGLRGQFRRLLIENEQLPGDIKIPREVIPLPSQDDRRVNVIFARRISFWIKIFARIFKVN